MNKKKLLVIGFIVMLASCKNKKAQEETTIESQAKQSEFTDISANFEIEILDDAALEVIDANAKIEELASGFTWVEGPLWVEDGQFLLFSDIPNNKVYKLSAENDTITYLHPSGFTKANFTGHEPGSNGLLLNNEGELVLMQHGERRVAKMNASLDQPDENYEAIVGTFKNKRLNSPNDGIYDSKGNLYFSDPPYGLPEMLDDPNKELDFQGVYCLLTTGELLLIDADLKFPNGVTLSHDESVLYVAVSNPEKPAWYRYDIETPGKVSNKQVLLDVSELVDEEFEHGLPDGLKVNSNEIIFATGPFGVWVMTQQGQVLARIRTGQLTSNCALSADEKTLFMTADDYILSVALK